MLTAAHCLNGYRELWVLYSEISGCLCFFNIESVDEAKDLALLKLVDDSNSKGNIAPLVVDWLGGLGEPQKNEKMIEYGCIPSLGNAEYDGRRREYLRHHEDFVVVDQLTGQGMSGGPAMWEGKLLGVMTARFDKADCHLLIRFDVVKTFLDKRSMLNNISHCSSWLLGRGFG